jgi:two-component system chemotaxis sensor kinase CheA
MSIDMSQLYQVFFDEAREHLAEMESLLLELNVDQPDLEMLNAIFRAAHSIKGGAGTFGFHDMAKVTHILETLLDRLRKQELPLTVEMVDAFLEAGDVLGCQLAAHQSQDGEYQDERIGRVCQRLDKLSQTESHTDSRSETRLEVTATPQTRRVWQIRFNPETAGFEAGFDFDSLAEMLADLGTLERSTETPSQAMHWRLTSDAVKRSDLLDLFAFVCDPQAIEITDDTAAAAPEADDDWNADHEYSGYGLFGGSPGMDQIAALAAQESQETAQGYGFFKDAPGTPKQPVTESADPDATKSAAAKRSSASDSSIRISVEKVDQLINLVGELVITHAMLAESVSDLEPIEHQSIFDGLSNLERNSRDLQQAVMSIRMMPISFVFNRFPRVVRDTAAILNKKVNLKLIGEDTELDKGLIERLADPLNHLVRNCIDHGIELPEQRLVAGKLETGEITLRASHQGGAIIIEVSDDGAGLNRAKLLAKATERGVELPEHPSDKEVWQLIFAPGFSTAAEVTDISGRGVGMDVVRRNIEQMNGRVDIDSALGHGTRITIRLPLTLAILDGMSVRMGEDIYILPLTAIRESVQPQPERLKRVAGQGQVLKVDEDYLPLVVLRKVFGMDTQPVNAEGGIEGIIVIVDTSEGRAALLVDELVAQHQVVIKSLETNYRKVEGISGATIMGNGRVALILDVDELVRLSRAVV